MASPDDLLGIAAGLAEAGAGDQALALCDRLLAAVPDHPGGLFLRGRIHLAAGAAAAARADLGRCAGLVAGNAAVALALVEADMAQGLDRAAALALAFATPAGRVAAVAAPLAALEAEAGRVDEARAILKAALEAAPEEAGLWLEAGRLHRAAGDLAAAARAVSAHIALAPDSARGWQDLATVFLLQDRHEAGLMALERARRVDPGSVAAIGALVDMFAMIAKGLIETDRWQEAPGAMRAHLVLTRGSAWWPCVGVTTGALLPPPPATALTTLSRLRHDAEQLRHLQGLGRLPPDLDDAPAAYEALIAAVCQSGVDPAFPFPLPPNLPAPIAGIVNRVVHLDEAGWPDAESPLNPAIDWAAVTAAYKANDPGIAVVDGLLTPKALAALRRFCLDSTIWFDSAHSGGYLGAYVNDGLVSPLLMRLQADLRRALPELLGPHSLRHLWAYKYDATLTGIGAHGDDAAVNVNFWITPDEANLDPEGGGLVIYPQEVPPSWSFSDFNNDAPAVTARRDAFIAAIGRPPVIVPHRQNRAVLFNSDMLHESGSVRFREGYENRRINVTLLYGDRGVGSQP